MSNKNLVIIYRTSDKGRIKPKLFADRWPFLENMFEVFSGIEIVCIADNVTDSSYKRLESYEFMSICRTNLGNSKSFWFSCKLLLSDFRSYQSVYFLEDDYVHRKGSYELIMEGLTVSEYMTLYDHPDKYYRGVNPKVSKKGGELSHVFLTESSHWKTTNSTTMTFAARIETLNKDRLFFKLFTDGWKHGNWLYPRWFFDKGLPRDYRLWWSLGFFRNRMLISCIPGRSTHGETDQLTPLW